MIDEEMEDTAEDPSQESQPIDAPKEASPEPAVVVSGGRRRGRRKIMKKKTIKDEEGFLGFFRSPYGDWQLDADCFTHSHERRTSVGIVFGGRAYAKGQGSRVECLVSSGKG